MWSFHVLFAAMNLFQHSWLFVQSKACLYLQTVMYTLHYFVIYYNCIVFKLVPITKINEIVSFDVKQRTMDCCKLSFSSKKHGLHRNKTVDTCSDIPYDTNNKTHIPSNDTYKPTCCRSYINNHTTLSSGLST